VEQSESEADDDNGNSSSSERWHSDADASDDDAPAIGRTKKPSPVGYKKLSKEAARKLLEVDGEEESGGWIDAVVEDADLVACRFDNVSWYTGDSLKRAQSDNEEDGLSVRYDDGDQVCHVKFDLAQCPSRWFFLTTTD
jgi:hypothetical protein